MVANRGSMMIRGNVRRMLLLSASLLLPALAAAAPPVALRQAGERFAAAYAAGDRYDLRTFWSGESAEEKRRFERALDSTLRVSCLDSAGVLITSIDAATGVVRATVGRWETRREGNARPRFIVRHVVLAFRERAGVWEAVRFDLAETELAARLMASPGRLTEILNDGGDLVTPDLATVLAERAISLNFTGETKQAEAAAHALDEVAARLADREQQSLAASVRSSMKGRTADLRGQLALAQKALELADGGRDPDILLRALIAVGRAYERMPDAEGAAMQGYDRALRLEPQIENRVLLARLYGNIAVLKLRRSDLLTAMMNFERSEQISIDEGDDSAIANTELGIAVLFQNQGNDSLAFTHLQRGLESATRVGDDAGRARILVLLADLYGGWGKEKESNDARDEALAIGRRIKDGLIIGECLRVSGMAHVRKHEYPEAMQDLEESIATFEAAGRPRFNAAVKVEMALARLESGDARSAVTSAEASAAFAQSLALDGSYIESKTIAGRAHHALGENEEALVALNQAIAVAEAKRAWIAGDPGAQERSFERASIPYRQASALLAEMGRLEETFTMMERAKARVLLDTLRTGHARIGDEMTADERRRDSELSVRLASLNRSLGTEAAKPVPDAAGMAKINDALRGVRAEYETFQTALYSQHPRLRQTRGDVPIATPADAARLLDPSSAIVMYQVMERQTIALVIRGAGASADFSRFTIDIDRDKLDRSVSELTGALATRDLRYAARSRALYDLLLRPLEKALRQATVLCLIPDDLLWRLPFEALIDRQGRFVIESRACFYAQSVSVLSEITRAGRGPRAPYALLAVGNPAVTVATRNESKTIYRGATLLPLPNAEQEVRALRTLYGAQSTRVYVGAAASEAAVKSDISEFRVLHFATHAEVNDENPMYAHIVLAQDPRAGDDGLLEAWEVMRMSLHADLTVLSACETAHGRVAAGEGLIGFSWALFVAGCPSSVVSHWKVASDSTASLMVDFHRHLLAGKAPFAKAAALRAAKLDMLRKTRWKHPFYWSAFVLIGAGG
jgi:CHAT domain-containing protein